MKASEEFAPNGGVARPMAAARGSQLLTSILVLAGAAAAQHRAAPRHDGGAYVPTGEGAAWEYAVTIVPPDDRTPGQSTVVYRLIGSYRDADDVRWHLVAREESSRRRWEEWRVDGRGLAVRAATAEAPPIRLPLAAPVGAVSTWRWQFTDAKGDFDVEAHLVAPLETITVPAGTFDAVHVANAGARSEPEDLWFARGIGLVRRECAGSNPGERERHELRRFQPGTDGAATRSSLLQMLAPAEWLAAPAGKLRIEWLDDGMPSVAFQGRFAILDNGSSRRAVYLADDGSKCFEVTPDTDWREIEALGLPFSVPRLAARLEAKRRGMYQVAYEGDGWRLRVHGKAAGEPAEFSLRTIGFGERAPLRIEIR